MASTEQTTDHGTASCAACAGLLVRFEAPPGIRGIDRAKLPAVCRRCGAVYVAGQALALPTEPWGKRDELGPSAAREGRAARKALASDPELRVEKYFDQVYRGGFIHGFTRALAYFTQHAKEGRLKRLRRLWEACDWTVAAGQVDVRMSEPAFLELTRLLEMDPAASGAHA